MAKGMLPVGAQSGTQGTCSQKQSRQPGFECDDIHSCLVGVVTEQVLSSPV